MDCRDALNALLDRLNSVPGAAPGSALDAHLASCASCRREAEALAAVWDRLGDDPEPAPSPGFRAKTLDLLEDEVSRRRVTPIRRFASFAQAPALLQAAILVLAAGAAFTAGRLARGGGPTPAPREAERIAVVPERMVDAARAVPDLSARPHLANVAYRPADGEGRIGVSFDVTTRYTVLGRPDQPALAGVLAYLGSGGETEGARGKAIELVAEHYGEHAAAPSREIVQMLASTLKGDRNPGVRKKAAEALAQLTPTPETRDALALALKTDTNPAVRMAAVEGLAKAAERLRDETTIKTLQEKATDERENGYIRGQAALALNRVKL